MRKRALRVYEPTVLPGSVKDRGPIEVTPHAMGRWMQRFPDRNLYQTYCSAAPAGRMTRKKLQKLNLASYDAYFRDRTWRGRSLLRTRDDIIFVCAFSPTELDLVITVFQLGVFD